MIPHRCNPFGLHLWRVYQLERTLDMLTSAIKFEIRNIKAGIQEQFLILNTVWNQEKVFSHRYTREIEFVEVFDFQFAKEMRIPAEMIDWSTELENELCDVDEMTGIVGVYA